MAEHRNFSLYEDAIGEQPGIHLDCTTDGDEIWLIVDRLVEIPPPAITDELLESWVELDTSPTASSPSLPTSKPLETLGLN